MTRVGMDFLHRLTKEWDMQLKGLLAVTVALIVAGPVQASLNAAAADKSPVQMNVQESNAEQ